MDRKLWTEARTIAARHDPAARDDLAQDLAVAALERGGRLHNPAAWLERWAGTPPSTVGGSTRGGGSCLNRSLVPSRRSIRSLPR